MRSKTEAPRIARLEMRHGGALAGCRRPCTIWLNAWYSCGVLPSLRYYSVTPVGTQLPFRHTQKATALGERMPAPRPGFSSQGIPFEQQQQRQQ